MFCNVSHHYAAISQHLEPFSGISWLFLSCFPTHINLTSTAGMFLLFHGISWAFCDQFLPVFGFIHLYNLLPIILWHFVIILQFFATICNNFTAFLAVLELFCGLIRHFSIVLCKMRSPTFDMISMSRACRPVFIVLNL